MPVVPQWAMKWKRKGTVFRKAAGERILLYSNRSVRVPGKKNPRSIQEYIGVVTPEGVLEDFTINTDSSGIRVWEYGFTKAVYTLVSEKFMNELGGGERARRVLGCIITSSSPNSYLLRDCGDWCDGIEGTCLSYQSRKLFTLMGVPQEELELLKQVHVIEIGGRSVVGDIGFRQEEISKRLGVDLRWQR